MRFRSKRKPDYRHIAQLEEEVGLADDNSVDLTEFQDLPAAPEIGGEPIVAWRAWSIKEVDRSREILEEILKRREIPEGLGPVVVKRLAPITYGDEVWPLHRFDARCLRGEATDGHIAPHKDCTCGVWAMKKETDVPGAQMWGQVYLWGKILEFSKGYRTQFAYPKCLYFNEKSPVHKKLVSELALLYDVPAEARTRKEIFGGHNMGTGLTIASAASFTIMPSVNFSSGNINFSQP